MKDVQFIGSSLADLREFSPAARSEAGFQLRRVQSGLDPDDWKPMPGVGTGVREIRIHAGGAFRVIYIASLPDKVYVLHCFHKKTQKTAQHDIELARQRFRQIEASR